MAILTIESDKRFLVTMTDSAGNTSTFTVDDDRCLAIPESAKGIIVRTEESDLKDRLARIKAVLTDCDGCLTDGGMYYSENGDELKKFNTRDGMAFSMLRHAGYFTGMVTGEDRELNRRRCEKLKLAFYIPGCKDKLKAVEKLCIENSITLEEVLYIGDDINDLDLLKAVGFSCCPANAVDEVRSIVDYVAKAKGGDGVIREISGLLL